MFQCFCRTISPLLRCSAALLFLHGRKVVPRCAVSLCHLYHCAVVFAASFRWSAALPCSTAPLFCCSAKPLLRCEIVPCGSLAPLLCCLVVLLLRGCSPDTSPRYTIGPQQSVVIIRRRCSPALSFRCTLVRSTPLFRLAIETG